MFDIGLGEMLALAVIALVVFGPDRLPKYAADAGRYLRSLRSMSEKARAELREAVGDDVAEVAFDPKGAMRRVVLPVEQEAKSLLGDEPPAPPASDVRRYDPDAT